MERKKAVAGIVKNQAGKILLGKKIANSKKTLSGQWHLLGEAVKGEETDQETLTRGVREETGIKIEVLEFACSHITPKGTLVNWYLCQAKNTNLTIGSDLEEARWVSPDEVSQLCGETAQALWPKEVKRLFEVTER